MQFKRARELGLKFIGRTGQYNSITDIPEVGVGYSTIVKGNGALVVGQGPVRTGLTAIAPRMLKDINVPLFAGIHSFNGNGELTGSHLIEETGCLKFPILITNTHSVGIARDSIIKWLNQFNSKYLADDFALPVIAETYDGVLNDINGMHVKEQDVYDALNNIVYDNVIQEGSVGGGTGMISFGFKSGSGTSSRVIEFGNHEFKIGAFVQSNFGKRKDLTILGNQIGLFTDLPEMNIKSAGANSSSIIVVIATDAPLFPHQLKRVARRATMALARLGTCGNHSSGDIYIAFSTAGKTSLSNPNYEINPYGYIFDENLDQFFVATVSAVEEAIINSMISNNDMTGRDNNFVPCLPHNVIF